LHACQGPYRFHFLRLLIPLLYFRMPLFSELTVVDIPHHRDHPSFITNIRLFQGYFRPE